MTIRVVEEVKVPFEFNYQGLAKQAVLAALEEEGFLYEAEADITLTDNASIRRINQQFRQIDAPTDVLSFPLLSLLGPGDFSGMESQAQDNFNPDTGEAMLGDIIISVEKAVEQAEAYGHSKEREFAFLVVHSVLHLLGYDHMTPQEAACMENKQESILNAMGIVR